MDKPIHLMFDNGHHAIASYVKRSEDLARTLRSLGLSSACPTLVVVGGASGLTLNYLEKLRTLFVDVFCPIMMHLQGAVVDGGTDAGVMQLMGQARSITQATFPLIGVAAQGTVCLPTDAPPSSQDYALLEPHHTHFLLVPGALWGDEVIWIHQAAGLLANGNSSLTVLINGGKIAWQDVSSSVRANRPVLVIAGSGRTADELAVAIRGDRSNNRANQLVDSGLLSCVELSEDQAALKQLLINFLRSK